MPSLLKVRDENDLLETTTAVSHYLSQNYGMDYNRNFNNYEKRTKHIGLSGNSVQDYKTLQGEIGNLPEDFSSKARGLADSNQGNLENTFNAFLKGASSKGVLSAAEGNLRLMTETGAIAGMGQGTGPFGSIGNPVEAALLAYDNREELRAAGREVGDEIQALRQKIEERLFTTDEFDQSKFGQIASGLGQAGGLMPAMFLPGGVGLSFTVMAGVGMSYDQGRQDYIDTRESLSLDWNEADAHRAAVLNLPTAAVGIATDRLLVGRILKSSIGQPIRNLSKAGGKSFVFGGLEEGTQEFWTNVSAKYLAGYDQDREITQGVVDAAIVGAFVDAGSFSFGASVRTLADKFVFNDTGGKQSDFVAMNKALGGRSAVEQAMLITFADPEISELAGAASEGDKDAYKALQEILLEKGASLNENLSQEESDSLENLDSAELTQEQRAEQAQLVMNNAIIRATENLNETLPENERVVLKLERTRTLQNQIDEMRSDGRLETEEQVQSYVSEVLTAAALDSDVDASEISPEDIIIKGRSISFNENSGFAQDVAIVYKGADLSTPFEEVAENYIKRQMKSGQVSREKLRNWKEQYEKTNERTHGDTDRDLVEWFSSMATGRAFASKNLDKGLRSTIKKFISYFQNVLEIGGILKKLETDGLIDKEFFTALDESTGMTDRQSETVNVDPESEQEFDDSFQIEIAVSPTATDSLSNLSKTEQNKRSKSAKFLHLQAVINDVAQAYGVNITARAATIAGYNTDGNPTIGVPEVITIDTDDMALAKEIASMIAMSAPQLQQNAYLTQPDPEGESAVYSIKLRSVSGAMDVIASMERIAFDTDADGEFVLDDEGNRIPLIQGFTFDNQTRIFSITLLQPNSQLEDALNDYIQENIDAGRISAKESLSATRANITNTTEAEYSRTLEQARKRLQGEQGERGQADVIARAEGKLKRFSDSRKVAVRAQGELNNLKIPDTSVLSILTGKETEFGSIRAFGKFLDARFATNHKVRRYAIPADIAELRTQINKLGRTKKLKAENADKIADLESQIAKIEPKIKRGIGNAADALVYDVLYSLSRNGSGMGWYDNTVNETLRELKKLYPELAEDPGELAVFVGILASTSQGETVVNNFKLANKVYRDYRDKGRIGKYKFSKASGPINQNLQIIQEAIDQYGTLGFMEIMDGEWTGDALAEQFGMEKPPSGVTLKETVKGNRILGPKIGSFFNNLRGDFSSITMDLWYTRTMHRYTGQTAEAVDGKKIQGYIKNFKKLHAAELKKPEGRTYGIESVENATDDEVVDAGLRVFARWSAGGDYLNEKGEPAKGYQKYKDGYQIEKMGRNLQTTAGMKGAPQNKSYREYFESIIVEGQKRLAKMGFELDSADIQAIVWYAEKELFVRTGVANQAAAPADYLDATMVTRLNADTFQIDWLDPKSRKEKLTRKPEVVAAAKALGQGEISYDDYRAVLAEFDPIEKFDVVPTLPTEEEMFNALDDGKKERLGLENFTRELVEGTRVGARLDIPAYKDHGIFVTALHDGGSGKIAGKSVGYQATARLKNVTMTANPFIAFKIAMGIQSKNTIATLEGEYVVASEQDNYDSAVKLFDDPEWTQVGYNPFRHSFFYDRQNDVGRPVVAADEVVQVGGFVLAKNVTYADPADDTFKIVDPNKTEASQERIKATLEREGISIDGDATFQVGVKQDLELSSDLTPEEETYERSYKERVAKEAQLRSRIGALKAEVRRIAFELDPGLKPGDPLPATLAALVPESMTPQGAKARKYKKAMQELDQAQQAYRETQVEGERLFQESKAARSKKRVQISAMKKLEKEVDRRLAKVKQLKNDRKNTVEAVRELELLVAALPTPVRGKFVGFRRLVNLQTEAGRQRFLELAEVRIQSIFNTYLYQERRGQLKSSLKAFKSRRSSKMRKLSSKYGKEARDKILYAYDLAFFNGLDEDIPRPPEGMAEEDAEFLRAVFSGVMIPGADSNRIATAFTYLKEVEANGRAEIEQFQIRKKRRNQDLKENTRDTILKGDKLNSPQRQQLEDSKKGLLSKLYNRVIGSVQLGQYGFEQLIELMDSVGVGFNETLNKTLFEPAFDADQREQTMNREDADIFMEAVIAVFPGLKSHQISKRIEGMRTQEENTGIFYDVGSGVEQQPMSILTAISMYNAMKDPSLQATFENMKVTADTVKALEEFIGPEGIALADFFMQAYKSKGLEVQAAHRTTEGFEMDLVENYAGRLYRIGADTSGTENTATLELADKGGRPTVKNGSLKARMGSTLALEFRDADTEFMKHSVEMNHYITHAQVAKDLQVVFRDPEVRRAIKQKHGQDFLSVLDNTIERILVGGERAALLQGFLGTLRSNMSVATIGLNMPSFLKQLTSFPAFMNSMPTKEYIKYQTAFFKDPINNLKEILSLPYIKNRLTTSYDRDVAEQIRRARGLLSGGIKSASDRFMFLTRMGDVGAIAAGGWPLYRYTYDQAIAAGKTEAQAKMAAEKAFSKASERTQQSTAALQLGTFQGASNSLLKLFTMFMTTPIQYQRTMDVAIRKAIQSGKVSSSQTKQALKSVAIFHILLPQIFSALSSGFIGFWSDDEEKREGFWKGQLRALLLGNFNSYFILGDGLELIANEVAGVKHPFQGEIESPALKEIAKLSKEFSDVLDDPTLKNFIDVIISGSKISGIPVAPVIRQASGIQDAATGDLSVGESILKLLGFSDYSMGRKSTKTSNQVMKLLGQ